MGEKKYKVLQDGWTSDKNLEGIYWRNVKGFCDKVNMVIKAQTAPELKSAAHQKSARLSWISQILTVIQHLRDLSKNGLTAYHIIHNMRELIHSDWKRKKTVRWIIYMLMHSHIYGV